MSTITSTSSTHFKLFLQKNIERKKRQPKQNGKYSSLRRTQIIYEDVDIDIDIDIEDDADMEVFEILKNFSECSSDSSFDYDDETFDCPRCVSTFHFELDF